MWYIQTGSTRHSRPPPPLPCTQPLGFFGCFTNLTIIILIFISKYGSHSFPLGEICRNIVCERRKKGVSVPVGVTEKIFQQINPPYSCKKQNGDQEKKWYRYCISICDRCSDSIKKLVCSCCCSTRRLAGVELSSLVG